MTCFRHMAPERMCSLCGRNYCDRDEHGHTPQVCMEILERGRDVAIASLIHFATNLKEAKRRQEKRT